MKKAKIKKIYTFITCLVGTLMWQIPVSAAAAGNPITQSSIFQGLTKMITDAGVALMIIIPIVCGVLIAAFSGMVGACDTDHDKEKWRKNRQTVITTLIWSFCASAIVTIVASYF